VERLTRFVLAHRLLVVAVWLALTAIGGVTAGTTIKRLTATFALPGRPGYVVDAQIVSQYRNLDPPDVPVVTLPSGQTVDQPGTRRRLADIFEAARLAPTYRVASYATTGNRAFVTTDRRSTYGLVFSPPPTSFSAKDPAVRITAAMRAAAPAGWRITTTGMNPLSAAGGGQKGPALLTEILLGGLGAIIVLALVFGSFLAVLPLVIAFVSIPTTFLCVLGLTHVTPISFIVQFLIGLIGLGVAIDYALLIVTRWREERDHGADNADAIAAAMTSAGRAVVLSGVTVAIGLLALVLLPVPFLRSVGYSGFLIPIVSVAVAVTLLPVMLAGIGPRLDRHRFRHEGHASRPWSAWARLILRVRIPAAILGISILGALAFPLTTIHIGEPRTSALSRTGPAHDALSILRTGGIPTGVLAPIEILTQNINPAPIAALARSTPGIFAAVAPKTTDYRRHGTALITVLPTAEASSHVGQQDVRNIRSALRHESGVVGVGGTAAEAIDFNNAVYGAFPLILGVVSLITFVLLARAFRSLLLPLKAVALNLLSVAAAYGSVVLIWQDGHASQAIWGIPATGAITNWVPISAFAFLFGLSMDYEVFLLARMREEYDRTNSTSTAVVHGLARTGRLVTSAALILFLAFLSLSSAPITDIKIMATTLGVGILLDATIVRCLLAPALVSMFGRYNWWLPASVARLLRVAPSPLSRDAPSIVSATPLAGGCTTAEAHHQESSVFRGFRS